MSGLRTITSNTRAETMSINMTDRDRLDMANDMIKYKKGTMRGFRRGGQIAKKRIKQLIKNPPKTGKKYRRLPNRSSQGGEAPAFQSGVLFRSADYSVFRWDYLAVGVTVLYGKFLEYGTKKPNGRTIMEPRPFVSRGCEETFQTVKIALSMGIDEELNK